MSDQNFDEKEREKREEKSWEEKGRDDPLSRVVWAAILIWAGLVLLAGNLGLLDRLFGAAETSFGFGFLAQVETWGIIFIGAGVIVLFEVLARLLMPEHRRMVGGRLILGFVLIGIGLGNVFGWNVIWPLILIGIGVSVLLGGLLRR